MISSCRDQSARCDDCSQLQSASAAHLAVRPLGDLAGRCAGEDRGVGVDQVSVHTPLVTVAEAPEVVFVVVYAPLPVNSGSPMLVPTAGLVSSCSPIQMRITPGVFAVAVSSINAVSSFEDTNGRMRARFCCAPDRATG
jgi:hypothetical protein